MTRGIGRRGASRRHRRKEFIAVAAVILVCAVALLAWRPVTHGAERWQARQWRSDSATPRLRWARLDGDPPVGVASFARVGEHLYLADRLASRVLRLSPSAGGAWRVDSILAQGPVVRTPVALAAAADGRLFVYDIDRSIHIFDLEGGAPARTVRASVPCDPGDAQLAVSRGGSIVLSGRCPTGNGDTVSAVLLISRDSGRSFVAAGAAPLYAKDGSWGSVLVAKHFARVYGDSAEFGTGRKGCVMRFALASPQTAVHDCGLVAAWYRAKEPPAFAAIRSLRVSLSMSSATATSWPRPLPAFLDRVATASGVALVRLVTGDSVQVEARAPNGATRPLLVAPLDGFRGCADDECLWLFDALGHTWVRAESFGRTGVDVDTSRRDVATGCPLHAGDTTTFSETTRTTLVLPGAQPAERQSSQSAALIRLAQGGARTNALYAVAQRPGGPNAPPLVFSFQGCGTGTATLRAGDTGDRGAELQYHLDGLVIVPPDGHLAVGAAWADTLARVDSVGAMRRVSRVERRFRVVADTMAEGDPAVVISFVGRGTVLRQDADASGDTPAAAAEADRVVVSTTTIGSAVVSRASRLMLRRTDSTAYTISAAAGSVRMADQTVSEVRRLVRVHP